MNSLKKEEKGNFAPLTIKQSRVLRYVIEHQQEFWTLTDIRKFMGTRSLSNIHSHLETLVNKGYLRHKRNVGYKLTKGVV